jgi:hypothetical protein
MAFLRDFDATGQGFGVGFEHSGFIELHPLAETFNESLKSSNENVPAGLLKRPQASGLVHMHQLEYLPVGSLEQREGLSHVLVALLEISDSVRRRSELSLQQTTVVLFESRPIPSQCVPILFWRRY